MLVKLEQKEIFYQISECMWYLMVYVFVTIFQNVILLRLVFFDEENSLKTKNLQGKGEEREYSL